MNDIGAEAEQRVNPSPKQGDRIAPGYGLVWDDVCKAYCDPHYNVEVKQEAPGRWRATYDYRIWWGEFVTIVTFSDFPTALEAAEVLDDMLKHAAERIKTARESLRAAEAHDE